MCLVGIVYCSVMYMLVCGVCVDLSTSCGDQHMCDVCVWCWCVLVLWCDVLMCVDELCCIAMVWYVRGWRMWFVHSVCGTLCVCYCNVYMLCVWCALRVLSCVIGVCG